jgi:hypothetical protein
MLSRDLDRSDRLATPRSPRRIVLRDLDEDQEYKTSDEDQKK